MEFRVVVPVASVTVMLAGFVTLICDVFVLNNRFYIVNDINNICMSL